MTRLTLVGLALLGLVCAAVAVDVGFQQGVNVTVNGDAVSDADLRYNGLGFRALSAHDMTVLGNGILVSSSGYFVSDSGGAIDIEIDAAYVTDKGFVAVNSRYAAAGFVVPALPILDWGGSASANMIAQFPYALVELDATGADYMVHRMEEFTWTVSDAIEVAAAATGRLVVKAFVGTKDVNGTEVIITISVQTSAETGLSTLHSQNLLPKTWAITFDIANYVLAAPENSLRLMMATATGDADSDTVGQLTAEAPDEKLQAYTDLAATATVNGGEVNVQLATFYEVDTVLLEELFPTVHTQLVARYDANVHVYMNNVTFAAGTQGFLYASRSGTGTRLNSLSRAGTDIPSPNAASSISLSYAVFVAIVALIGFFAY